MTGGVPTTWRVANLGAFISRIEAGVSFKCDERPPENGETGIVKVSAVSWGEYDDDESKTVRASDRIVESLLIEPGNFLFSRANTIGLVGACVIARRVRRRVMLSDKILRLHFSGIIPEYALHFLRSKAGRAEIERLASGNQESMRNIGQDRIRAIRIPVAPPDVQARIVATVDEHLSALDATSAGLERARANVSRLRNSILTSAFDGTLVGPDAHPGKAPPDSGVETPSWPPSQH